MATTAIVDLKNFTPNIVKDQPLWEDFLDTVSDELDLIRTEIELKQRIFETNQYDESTELVALAKSLGYIPNLILNDDIDYVRTEVDSIVFKIKNKATYAYYNYLFKLIPRTGQVYILFQDSLALARAIDFDATYLALGTHDIATPFVGMRSILHYNTYFDISTQLDLTPDPLYLDEEETPWFLDQDIVIKPTQHLAIEYQIGQLVQNEAGEDVLLTSDYFDYLSVGVEYGRKVTNIPHIGANLSIPIGNSGFANDFSSAENIAQGTEDEQYTIPALKTKAALSQFGLTDTDYKYIAVGTRAKGFYNTEDSRLTDPANIDISMSFENGNGGTTFSDNYSDLEAVVISGTHQIGDGISGKTIEWNGVDTRVQATGVTLADTDREWSIWADMYSTISSNPIFFSIEDKIQLYYNTYSGDIILSIYGSLDYARIDYDIPYFDRFAPFMLSVQIIKGVTLKLFSNAVEVGSVDISGIGDVIIDNEDLYIGCNEGGWNIFTGRLDELKCYSMALTSAERSALYERKLGTLNHLSNEIFRKEISNNQIGESVGWRHAVGTIPANTVNNEIVFIGDDSTFTIDATLEFPDISPGYVEFAYYSFPNFYTAKANERGQIFGDAATGTIDFETGNFQLVTYRDYAVNKELISTGATSVIAHTAEFTNIVPSTATLHYIVNGTSYAIEDDGAGNFVHAPTLTTATLVYSSGSLSATFVNPTEVDPAEVYIAYDYRKESIPSLDEDVTVEYKLLNSLPIEEVAILNSAGDVLIYATTPEIEYNSVVNHTGYQFFVLGRRFLPISFPLTKTTSDGETKITSDFDIKTTSSNQ